MTLLGEELRGDVLRIVADSDMVGGVIELEILKDGKTVYVDFAGWGEEVGQDPWREMRTGAGKEPEI